MKTFPRASLFTLLTAFPLAAARAQTFYVDCSSGNPAPPSAAYGAAYGIR